MATFAQGFVRPGVYVKETAGQEAGQLPSSFSAVFIGHGSSTMRRTVDIVRGSGDSDILDSERETDSLISVVNKNTGVEYFPRLISQNGSSTISWVTETGDPITPAPAEGETYVVTYNAIKNPKIDYTVKKFTNFADQLAYSGAPEESASDVLSGTKIKNNISLAVDIALKQGMAAWYSLELNPWDETTLDSNPVALDLTTESGLKTAVQQALEKLKTEDVYAIVPLFPIVQNGVNSSILSDIIGHIQFGRSLIEQKWRIAILGAEANSDTGATPESKYIETASAISYDAMAYVAPSTVKITYGGTQMTVDGYAIAAAIAGILTNPVYDAGEPISGKKLIGFDEIADPFNNTQKRLMGNAGVLMIDNELGVPAVIMDLTTDQSNAARAQLKFIKTADYVAKTLRLLLRQLYINTRNIGTATLAAIAGTIRMVMQQLIFLHIINDFSDLSVRKNDIDGRQIDVIVNIQMTPDVSWIYINLGVKI